jgi:DNA polymerase III sliding clamp (beta) subunit (PCNA family)
MYEMLLVWFFCIIFFTLGNIGIVLTRKPIQRANKPDCGDNGNFCPKCGEHFAVHNDDGSCIEGVTETDFSNTILRPEFEVETKIIVPKKLERTGKATMLVENLSKALNICKDSYGSRCLPILEKVKIDFKDGIAKFTTTNLDTMIIATCGCKIESEFTCLLPFKILKELSEALYDDVVTFEQTYIESDTYKYVHGTNLAIIKIKQGRQTITLFDADIQDYPPMPKVEGQSVVISDIGDAIKKVKDKMIPMDSKHWNCGKFAGLYFDLSKPNIVASDGNRMKIATLNCEPKDIQFRIDKDCALILAKFKDMECLVTAGENQTRFDFGLYMQGEYPSIKTTILTQNLQGTYPDYEALKESHKEAVSVL